MCQWSKINHVNVLIKLPVLECEIQSSDFAWDWRIWRILEHWFPFVQHWLVPLISIVFLHVHIVKRRPCPGTGLPDQFWGLPHWSCKRCTVRMDPHGKYVSRTRGKSMLYTSDMFWSSDHKRATWKSGLSLPIISTWFYTTNTMNTH